MSTTDSPLRSFSWWSAFVGGFVGMGASAFLGTLTSNASLWFFMRQGMSAQEAYARMGSNFTSPVELLSSALLCGSSVFGGYISALYGGSRHIAQGAAAGVVSSLFFFAMSLNPVGQVTPAWYLPASVASAIAFGLVGGYIRARNA